MPARDPRQRDKSRTHRLLVVGSAAICAVYAAGYARTEPVAHEIAATAAAFARQSEHSKPQPSSSTPPTGSTSASVPPTVSSPSVSPSSSTSTPGKSSSGKAATTTSSGKFKDGSYTAVGYGIHGPVQVTLQIQGGKIVSANITGCGTTFSCSVISALSSEVVAQQAPPVSYVSGATASSLAYYQAVVQALAKAE